MSDRLGVSPAAVALGNANESIVLKLGAHGAQLAYLYDHPDLSGLHPDVCLPLLDTAVRKYAPRIILFPSDRTMRILAATLGARLGVAVASECTKLDIDGDGHLLVNRPVFGKAVGESDMSVRSANRDVPGWLRETRRRALRDTSGPIARVDDCRAQVDHRSASSATRRARWT